MNATSMRKLAEQQMMRTRVRQRIALAAARAADTCDCPVCTMRRAGTLTPASFGDLLRKMAGGDEAAPAAPTSEPRH